MEFTWASLTVSQLSSLSPAFFQTRPSRMISRKDEP